ncbi:TPA: hypothetical protein EYP66_20345, partial [Candidatus Poribacteria bacterium]|nr:hypothetical protein [Candidatus Poribacteria bacterium]
MAVKIIMTWDISKENEQKYFEFIINEFIPGVQKLGFHPLDAWATVYGNYPQIQVGMIASDIADAQHMLNTVEWGVLEEKLLEFID